MIKPIVAAAFAISAAACAAPWMPRAEAADAGSIDAQVAPVVIDAKTGTGQTWVYVRNGSAANATPTLRIGAFTDAVTGRVLAAQGGFVAGPQSSPVPIAAVPVKAGETAAVKLVVSGYSEPGESTATVAVAGKNYPLHASLLAVPFKVTVQAEAPGKPHLLLHKGANALLILENGDPYRYPVHWRLFLPDSGAVAEGTADLPAASTAPVQFSPPAGWFRHWFEGLFKNDQRAGYVTVQWSPRKNAANGPSRDLEPLPARTVPVALELSLREGWKVLGNIVILLALALGAVLSMVLNGWIPNYLRRSDLLLRLDALANDTRHLSSQMDSRLRVALRVQRLHLSETLMKRSVLALDTGDRLKQFENEADALQRRLQMVTEVDAASRRLDSLQSEDLQAPPSALDAASASLGEAVEHLCKATMQDSDYQRARTAIDVALAAMDRVGKDDQAFAQALATRVSALKQQLDPSGPVASSKAYVRLQGPFSPLFGLLTLNRYATPATIDRSEYRALDFGLHKLAILARFIAAADAVAASPADAEGAAIVAGVEQEMTGLLRRNDWHALRRARRLLSQIDERIVPAQIEEALRNKAFRIVWDPYAVRQNEPVRLRVHLDNPDFDDSTARDDFQCVWRFPPQVGSEHGWEIAHYFRRQQEADLEVSFVKLNGEHIAHEGTEPAGAPWKPRIKVTAPETARLSDRSRAEMWRLVLAMALAVMGLIAGAREQFMKLDVFFGLLTVVLLGFSVDTIKNLFSKRT